LDGPGAGHGGTEQRDGAGRKRRPARLQQAQPRGRGRRRRLLRALPRHDLRPRAGRPALEDPADGRPDPVTRVAAALAVLVALAAASTAAAAEPRLAALPSPLAGLSPSPPLGTGA